MTKRNGEVIVKNSTVYPFKLPRECIVCLFCRDNFDEPTEFRKHMDLEHETFSVLLVFSYNVDGFVKADCSDIRCRICSEKSDSVEKIAIHLKNHHSTIAETLDLTAPLGIQPFNFNLDKYGCAICETKFFSLHQLSRHTQSHFQRYTCESCGKAYSSNAGLQSHIKDFHLKKYYCKKCKTNFTNANEIKTHTLESKKCWLHSCNICKEKFLTYKAKQLHIKETHEVEKKLYNCPECGMVFAYKTACSHHFKEVHTDDNFTCIFCEQKFATKGRYEQHRLTHTKEKPFTCDVCFRSYNRVKNLTQHKCTPLKKR